MHISQSNVPSAVDEMHNGLHFQFEHVLRIQNLAFVPMKLMIRFYIIVTTGQFNKLFYLISEKQFKYLMTLYFIVLLDYDYTVLFFVCQKHAISQVAWTNENRRAIDV